MTAAPDPAEITPPTDPAAYGRPRRFGVAFWAVVALCLLSLAVGAAATRFASMIWGNNASGFQFGFPITAVANVYTTGNVLFYSAGITIQSGEAGGFFGLASTTDLITA